MTRARIFLPLQRLSPPLTDLTSFTAASTTSSYVEDWIAHTHAANLPLSKVTKKRNRSLSPSAPSTLYGTHTKRRCKSFGERECDIAAGTMLDPLTTPDGKARAGVSGQMTPSASYPSIPYTPTNSSKRVKNATWIGSRMDQQDIIEDNEADITGHPEILAIIGNILDNPRGSEMKHGSAERIIESHKYYKNANEDTILNELIPLISRKDYMKLVGSDAGGDEHGTETGEKQYVLEDWFTAGVVTASNLNFLDGFMPSKYNEGQFHKDLVNKLKKDDKMTTPRPDRCMGIRSDKFANSKDTTLDIAIEEAIRICPEMDHAFLIIEGKSNGGHIGEAENQARRGGAVLVNANRALRATAGELDVDGADSNTVVFSGTMNAHFISLHIHWAEVQKERIIYHMTCFMHTGFVMRRQLPALRQAINNIKQWGAVDRMPGLMKLRENLYQVSAERLKQRDEEMRDMAMDKENKKRKRALGSNP